MRMLNYIFWGVLGLRLLTFSLWFIFLYPIIILFFVLCDFLIEDNIK